MDAFEYASPATVKEALALLGANFQDASVYGGGTDLLSLLKDNVEDTKRLVNIKKIGALHAIQNERGGLRIGAAVTLEQVLSASDVREHFRAITDAAEHISSPQIHNMATVGGWICQRPRCWYYRNGFGLFALDKMATRSSPTATIAITRFSATPVWPNSSALPASARRFLPSMAEFISKARTARAKPPSKSFSSSRKKRVSVNTPWARKKSSLPSAFLRLRAKRRAPCTRFARRKAWTGR